jgi:hypothetical protein
VASGSAPGDIADIRGGLFSLGYILGTPWNAYDVGSTPNLLAYPAALLGFGGWITYPVVGAIGLVGSVWLARSRGPRGAFGRFALASTVLLLLVHLPYFFRDDRFLIIPAALNSVCAAVLIARMLALAARKLVAENRGAPLAQ